MPEPVTVAVLHDSTEFGGHERAFLTWLPALLRSPQVASVVVWTPQAASRFRESLAALQSDKLSVISHPFRKQRAEPFLAPFRLRYATAVRRFVGDLAPDVVLLLQGRIENLSVPMRWLPRRTVLVSYIPMAHLGPEMGRSRRVSALTDRVKRAYYRRPQSWITVSNAVTDQLRRAGARSPVSVVENVPPATPTRVPSTLSSNRHIELPSFQLGESALRTALFMGRFDLGQKGLDRLVSVLRRDATTLRGWRFLFVGQGPAEPSLRELISAGAVQGEVREWTEYPEDVLRACDVLLLPSRFEGVPLILLEAMQAETAVLASPIDVFKEYLPPVSLFDFDGPQPLDAALQSLLSTEGRAEYQAQARAVMARLTPEASGEAFLTAVLGAARGAQESRP